MSIVSSRSLVIGKRSRLALVKIASLEVVPDVENVIRAMCFVRPPLRLQSKCIHNL